MIRHISVFTSPEQPPMCSAFFSASKGAVAAVTMQAAVEWAGLGVRVNCAAPGGAPVCLRRIPPF